MLFTAFAIPEIIGVLPAFVLNLDVRTDVSDSARDADVSASAPPSFWMLFVGSASVSSGGATSACFGLPKPMTPEDNILPERPSGCEMQSSCSM